MGQFFCFGKPRVKTKISWFAAFSAECVSLLHKKIYLAMREEKWKKKKEKQRKNI